MLRFHCLNWMLFSCVVSLLVPPARAQDEPAVAAVDFARDVKPIFERYCIHCHGPNKAESFRIDNAEEALAYVEAGDPASSDLYDVLTTDDEGLLMPPPTEELRPTKAEIKTVRTWIKEGAAWPQEVKLVDPADADLPPPLGADKPLGMRIWRAVGPLHPAAVHLPIGLLLGAGLFALLGIRGNFVMSDSAYYCLWVGALTSVVACVLGWSYAIGKGYGGDFDELFDTSKSIFWHRITGIGISLAAILLALFASSARARDPDDGFLWKLGAMLLAVGIGIVGHQGGELTYGPNHYQELKRVVETISGWDLGTGPAAPANESAPNSEPGVGDTSSESDQPPPGDPNTGGEGGQGSGGDAPTGGEPAQQSIGNPSGSSAQPNKVD